MADTLGERLRTAREVKGFTLRHVAETIGVSAPHLHDVEKDRRNLSDERARALAELLGLDADAIVKENADRRARQSFEALRHHCPRCGYPGADTRGPLR